MNTMEFLELARNRYSERRYDSRPVEQEKIDKILEAGRVAPTACNYQPQRFYLIRSETAREKLKQVTRFHFDAPAAVLVCYDNDTVCYIGKETYLKDYNTGDQDASIAATSMMFEAEDLGVHTLWVRGFDAANVRKVFGLPDSMVPVMILLLGYPAADARANDWHFRRMPLGDFVREV